MGCSLTNSMGYLFPEANPRGWAEKLEYSLVLCQTYYVLGECAGHMVGVIVGVGISG